LVALLSLGACSHDDGDPNASPSDIVIAATAVAYTVNPRMAVARFIAGLLAAVLIGLGVDLARASSPRG